MQRRGVFREHKMTTIIGLMMLGLAIYGAFKLAQKAI